MTRVDEYFELCGKRSQARYEGADSAVIEEYKKRCKDLINSFDEQEFDELIERLPIGQARHAFKIMRDEKFGTA